MSLHMTITCDGTRNGQPCRGAFHSRYPDKARALIEAMRLGWTWSATTPMQNRCPSRGHDQAGTS